MLRTVERLFCHYRETDDARALGAVFDRTAKELLRVALHLTRDRHRAEDLLQDTFLTAMEKARQYDARLRLLPWLLAILANLARQERRKERRPLPPVAETAGADVADQAAARELTQVCDRAIDALAEPYRHVLILHLRHGMSRLEIAQALARPDSTVRNQIARGLDLLRRKLPASIASAAALLGAGGRGLAAVRAAILARAPAPAAAVGTSLALGVLLMGKKIVVVLGLLAVVAAGGMWYSGALGSTAMTASPPVTASIAAATRTSADKASSAAAAATDARTEPSRLEVRPAATGLLVAEVVLEDGSPVAGWPYEVTLMTAQGSRIIAEGTTAQDGTARFTDLLPGGYGFHLAGQRDHSHSFVIDAGDDKRKRFQMWRGWRLDGSVVDRTGRSVADAEVRCEGDMHSELLARSAVDGRFAAPFLLGSVDVIAIAPGRQPSKSMYLGPDAARLPVRFVVGDAGTRLSGRVLDEQRQPVQGALVFLGIDLHEGTPFAQRKLLDVRTGSDGAFAADWLSPGSLFVGALPRDGDIARASSLWLELEAGVAQLIELQLGDGARVTGQVRDEQGKALPEVFVTAGVNDTGLGPFDSHACRTDASGSFVLAGLAACKHRLSAQYNSAILAEATVELHRRQEFRWNPTLGRGWTLALLLLDPEGRPMPDHAIELRPAGARSDQIAAARTGSDGRYRFEHLPEGECTLRVLTEAWSLCIAERQVVPGGGEVVLRVDAARMPSARLSGRVVDARGKPVFDCEVSFSPGDGGYVEKLRVDRDGRVATGLVPAGSYNLSVRSDHVHGDAWGNFQLAAHQERDIGDLVLPDAASLAVRLAARDGLPVHGAVLRIGNAKDAWPGSEDLQADEVDGVYRKDGINPGSYVLRFFAADAAPQCVPFELLPGQRPELELIAQRALPVAIELLCTNAGNNGICNGILTVSDGAGQQVLFHSLWGYFTDWQRKTKRVAIALPPGTYRVHAQERGGRTADVELVVPAGGRPEPFAIDLR
jgi:RNA polymerase sigma-70 factor (ECF subfamily)